MLGYEEVIRAMIHYHPWTCPKACCCKLINSNKCIGFFPFFFYTMTNSDVCVSNTHVLLLELTVILLWATVLINCDSATIYWSEGKHINRLQQLGRKVVR